MNATIERLSRNPAHRGAIFQDDADEKAVVLLQTKIDNLKIYLMVDPVENLVMQARFFTYGGILFTAIAEVHCSLMEGTTVDRAFSVTPDEVELRLREGPDERALPEDSPELARVAEFSKSFAADYPEKKAAALALRAVRAKFADLGPSASEIRRASDAKWLEADDEERMEMVERVLESDIRAPLRADGGDARLVRIDDPATVVIEYSGACGNCSAASGGTLFYIEDTLRDRVFSGIRVEPLTAGSGENGEIPHVGVGL